MAETMQDNLSFTFHNVSINTKNKSYISGRLPRFTFHNVSINTLFHLFLRLLRPSLHSTMFLLIPHLALTDRFISFFTFHNVSINTMFLMCYTEIMMIFTFHNVSINTRTSNWKCLNLISLHSTMFLLIRITVITLSRVLLALHSTMFLLIRLFGK